MSQARHRLAEAVGIGKHTLMTDTPDAPKPLAVPRARLGIIWLVLLTLAAVVLVARVLPDVTTTLVSAERTIGGPFTLTDHKGQRVTEAVLAGKPYAMFFGFTHCPDVCPTTLQDMTGWLTKLGPDADKLRMVFVTVDPARDTPAALGEYLKSFDPRILGLTGGDEEMASMLRAYRVYARKGETKNGGYDMDHTAAIYLMDRRGDLKTVIGYGEKSDQSLVKLKDLIGG
jgi:protein SCO1